jgi:hypothetical protein
VPAEGLPPASDLVVGPRLLANLQPQEVALQKLVKALAPVAGDAGCLARRRQRPGQSLLKAELEAALAGQKGRQVASAEA